jgi:dTDP-4-amino-4,6-dideoxygalactose transaminase
MFRKKYGTKILNNCEIIDSYGIYLPCHDKLTLDDIKFISDIVNSI